jgi:hypothetical protein
LKNADLHKIHVSTRKGNWICYILRKTAFYNRLLQKREKERNISDRKTRNKT